MHRLIAPVVLTALAFMGTAGLSQDVHAHCEVPCGIYADQMRFEMMLEDTATIEKAMGEIAALTGKSDPQSANQLARWVATKEDHATKTQHIIAQYFMTQRIKPGEDEAGNQKYVDQLTKAHAVLLAAMKCKQTVDPKNAAVLKNAILALHKAYTGK